MTWQECSAEQNGGGAPAIAKKRERQVTPNISQKMHHLRDSASGLACVEHMEWPLHRNDCSPAPWDAIEVDYPVWRPWPGKRRWFVYPAIMAFDKIYFISIHDYGKYADAEVRKWLGLKNWKEWRGTEPRIVRR